MWLTGATEIRFETASIATSRCSGHAYSMKVQATPEPVRLRMDNVSLKFCVQQGDTVIDLVIVDRAVPRPTTP